MSHSERCLSANRFGDGFDCICDEEPLPKALARIEERLVAEASTLLADTLRRETKVRERAVDIEEEKQVLEKQIEGYALGLKAFAANPKLGGMVPAPAVANELMRIIGKEPSDIEAIERDKAMKAQLSARWDEFAGNLPTVIAAGHDKVSTTEEPIRLPVPARIRRHGGLGPVIIAAEYVANQWEMGNVPSEESLETLCKAMKLYSRLSVAIEKSRCATCGAVICTCPEPAA